jgi:hypothetical protein
VEYYTAVKMNPSIALIHSTDGLPHLSFKENKLFPPGPNPVADVHRRRRKFGHRRMSCGPEMARERQTG